MKEVSQLIFEVLTNNTAFADVMGTKCYPLLAKEGVSHPFTVYSIGEVTPLSYDSRSFPVTVSLCYAPDKYLDAVVFADVVKDIFEDVPNCNFQSTIPSFEEDSQMIMININLLITK